MEEQVSLHSSRFYRWYTDILYINEAAVYRANDWGSIHGLNTTDRNTKTSALPTVLYRCETWSLTVRDSAQSVMEVSLHKCDV
jgi:hypothetical protein